jgi:hypothetical protein
MLFHTVDLSAVIKGTNEHYLKPRQIEASTKSRRFKSPANCDHTAFVEQLKEQAKIWETQRNRGDAQAATELATIQSQLEKANQSSREFGSLFASSGLRVMERPEFLQEPGSAQPKGKAASTNVNFLLNWATSYAHIIFIPASFLPTGDHQSYFCSPPQISRDGASSGDLGMSWTESQGHLAVRQRPYQQTLERRRS